MALNLTGHKFAPIKTERLLLRPLQGDDAAALHRLVNDWAVVRNLSRLPFPYPRALADEWIASTGRQIEGGTGYHLAITGQEAGSELVGCIGLRLDMTPRVGNLGYWVGRRFWGHGVASEAVGRLARWGLANLDLERLEAHVAEDNPASAAVLRRAGFRETGRGEEVFLARGGKHAVVTFAATRDDLFPGGEAQGAAPVGGTVVEAGGGEADGAGFGGGVDRRGWAGVADAAAGGEDDGGVVGVSGGEG